MERSTIYPRLSRYCYCWEWEAQYRVIKPDKQKKLWVDRAIGFLAEDVDECQRVIARYCAEKGWKLVEIYFIKAHRLAFCFDRDGPDDEWVSSAEQYKICPWPAPFGKEYVEKTAAQLQQEKQQAKLQAKYPLLASILTINS